MNESDLPAIISRDGLKLHVSSNHVTKPIAALLIIHGFGEHIGRYQHVYDALAAENILTYGMDLRGHGLSAGKKGHARSYDLLMDDVEELMKTCRVTYNDVPMILFGHSMGGNLVANYVIRRPQNELVGFVLSSPWIKLAFDPPAWQTKAAAVLAKILPKLTMDNKLNANQLSKIPKVAEDYNKDPLVNNHISAGLYQMITKAGEYALMHRTSLDLPGLIYHGTGDQITSHEATKKLGEGIKNITWISYENVYHEGHNDEEQSLILNNLIQWIKELV